jgi:hypothetical protein
MTTVSSGQNITLTMPSGYFLGTVSSISTIVTALTATSSSAAISNSNAIVLTTGGAAIGTVALAVTLNGLTLGAVQGATTAGFKLSSSADAALSTGLDAPAIVTIKAQRNLSVASATYCDVLLLSCLIAALN